MTPILIPFFSMLLSLPRVTAPAPPQHPLSKAFRWVGAVVSRNAGTPIQRLHLFVDPHALRQAIRAPQFRGLDPGEASYRVLASGRIPHAWRGEYLLDIGGAVRRDKVLSYLKHYWPSGTPDPEQPVVKAFLLRMEERRDQGDEVEQILTPGNVLLRHRSGPWTSFKDQNLYRALCSGNMDLPPEPLASIKQALSVFVSR